MRRDSKVLEFSPHFSGSAGNFYTLADDGEDMIAIEAGVRFKDIRVALDFKVTSLVGCLISHAHGDHSMAAKDLTKAGVDCYATRETWEQLQIKSHRAHTISPLEEFMVGGWRVLPFPCVHDCVGTVGFLIGSPRGEKLAFMTDSMYSPFKFEGVSIVACECNHDLGIMRSQRDAGRLDSARLNRTARTHMSLERCIEMLKANDLSKVREIWLLHLSNQNSDEAEFKLAVQRATGCPVFVAAERPGSVL